MSGKPAQPSAQVEKPGGSPLKPENLSPEPAKQPLNNDPLPPLKPFEEVKGANEGGLEPLPPLGAPLANEPLQPLNQPLEPLGQPLEPLNGPLDNNQNLPQKENPKKEENSPSKPEKPKPQESPSKKQVGGGNSAPIQYHTGKQLRKNTGRGPEISDKERARQDQENSEIIKMRRLGSALVIFTIFLVLLFFQVLAFYYNATLMTDDVEVESWLSIFYFVITLTNLVFNTLNYNLISNGLRDLLSVWRFIVVFYGVGVTIAGCVILGYGIENNSEHSNDKWDTLSFNQQDHFGSLSKFKAKRKELISVFGSFTLVVGVLQLVTSYFCHQLYTLVPIGASKNKNSISRHNFQSENIQDDCDQYRVVKEVGQMSAIEEYMVWRPKPVQVDIFQKYQERQDLTEQQRRQHEIEMRNQQMLDVARQENEIKYGAMPAHLMQNPVPPTYSYHGDTRIGFAGDIVGAPKEYESLNYRPPVSGNNNHRGMSMAPGMGQSQGFGGMGGQPGAQSYGAGAGGHSYTGKW